MSRLRDYICCVTGDQNDKSIIKKTVVGVHDVPEYQENHNIANFWLPTFVRKRRYARESEERARYPVEKSESKVQDDFSYTTTTFFLNIDGFLANNDDIKKIK